jgi:hypothetical protein
VKCKENPHPDMFPDAEKAFNCFKGARLTFSGLVELIERLSSSNREGNEKLFIV